MTDGPSIRAASIMYASLTDELGTQRPVVIRERAVDPDQLPDILDPSVRYSLVDVWLHEHETWCENVLVPMYRMGPETPDPAPLPPSMADTLVSRRHRL